MKVIKTYKYQLRPSKEKEVKFYQILGVCRLIYNLCLEYKIMLYREHGQTVGKTQLQKEVSGLSKCFDWMKAVHSQLRQNAIHRLLTAYDNFFKVGAGFPKFAKRDLYNSFTYPQGIKICNNYIYFPKVGWIRFYPNQKLPTDAVIKTTTIIKEADAWHVSITFETADQIQYPFDENQATGYDIGVKYYYVSSDGEFIDNPSFLKQFARKIRKLNRKLARQKKGSNRRRKTKISLQKTYLKLKRKRKDFINKLTFNIVKNNSIIVVEDLQLKNMTKKPKPKLAEDGKTYLPNKAKAKGGLNRVLLDLGVSEFYRQLEYKAKWYGRELIKVDPKYTSQECSNCNHISKNNRKSQSKFECESCGHTANADYDAAQVILGRGLSFYRQREVLACA